MLNENVYIFLIAPNVSEQMGGEAIKALHIFQELSKIHPNTIQVTHERNRFEINERLGLNRVLYVEDTFFAKFLWMSKIFRWLLNIWFCRAALRKVESTISAKNIEKNKVIIHQTEPNSPVMPRFVSKSGLNVFGPINGNIYYPRMFRASEVLSAKLRRIFHLPFQHFNRYFFKGAQKADLLMIAGGARTKDSMLIGGVQEEKMIDCLDCGIRDELLDRPRAEHKNKNTKFIHFGRLVFHKGTALIIKSLAKTRENIVLDIVGKGPELDSCRDLVSKLNLKDRVNFLGWYERHEQLFESFTNYRGFVLPSIEDANGIVVQESMALGLPGICLDWGGPQLLIEHGVSGYLIEPVNEDYITKHIADYMDNLSVDAALAECMSISCRKRAEEWRWSNVMSEWSRHYTKLL